MENYDQKYARLEKDLRFFKQEAKGANRDERINALKQVRAVETELLNTLKKEKEQYARETANMQKAIQKLTEMRNKSGNPQ